DVVMTLETELPPETGGPDAVDVVVDHHSVVVADARRSDDLAEPLGRNCGKGCLAVVDSEVDQLVEEPGAGDVRLAVGLTTRLGVGAVGIEGEVHGRVDDPDRGVVEAALEP